MHVSTNPTPEASSRGLVGSFWCGIFIPHPDAPQHGSLEEEEELRKGLEEPQGTFCHGIFIPHPDAIEDGCIEEESSPVPVDHTSPSSTGLRDGAAYASLQASQTQPNSQRDSVGGGNGQSKGKANMPQGPFKRPTKRRLTFSKDYVKAKVQCMLPTLTYARMLIRMSKPTHECTQSEADLSYTIDEFQLANDLEVKPLEEVLEQYGFTASLSRTVSSPPDAAEWSDAPVYPSEEPAPCTAGPSICYYTDVSDTWVTCGGRAPPPSPASLAPLSPRLEGQNKDEDLDLLMDDLHI